MECCFHILGMVCLASLAGEILANGTRDRPEEAMDRALGSGFDVLGVWRVWSVWSV